MLVGDSHGTVVLFCDGQISQHRSTPSGKINKVTALEVHETACELHFKKNVRASSLSCNSSFPLKMQ